MKYPELCASSSEVWVVARTEAKTGNVTRSTVELPATEVGRVGFEPTTTPSTRGSIRSLRFATAEVVK